jgi:predicted DCC family thiol-disulfide oxidoreductase YuxK
MPSQTPPAPTVAPPARARSRVEASSDAWTGGQYSLFRAFLGLSLAAHFAWLVSLSADLLVTPTVGFYSPAVDWLVEASGPGTAVEIVRGLLIVGVVLHVLVAVGWKDWLSSLLLVPLWLCLVGRDPLVSATGQATVILLLLLHATMPRAPYGSLMAYARIDPRGGWHHVRRSWGIGWVALVVGYAVAGWMLLQHADWVDGTALAHLFEGPLARPGFVTDVLRGLPAGVTTAATYGVLGAALLFAPFALFRPLRPWLWTLLLALQLLRMALFDVASAAPMVILLHAFTFDPTWLPAKGGKGPSTVFYDGGCGLCHRFVRMLLAEDRSGETFCFAPLAGTTFAVAVPEGPLGQLPDSVIVRSPCGDLLMHSDAALHCLRRLGGVWRLIATAVRLVPRPVRDTVYKGIAAIRKSVFAKPDNACPILPPDLQQRFLP